MNSDSRFHLAFNIGYPNELDRANHRTGSAIMVHGDRKSIGCLAMTDEKIEEIYTLCAAAHAAGQSFFCVHLFPFRMTAERMEMAAKSFNFAFWQDLKEGHDLFEKERIPPRILVVDGRYHCSDARDRCAQ
jgi:murein L,D-transpeptidase YafK